MTFGDGQLLSALLRGFTVDERAEALRQLQRADAAHGVAPLVPALPPVRRPRGEPPTPTSAAASATSYRRATYTVEELDAAAAQPAREGPTAPSEG